MFTVAFLSSELVVIVESFMISPICHTCDPEIMVLRRFVPFKVEVVETEFVNSELLNIVDDVVSEFISVESFMLEFVELELVKIELLIFELVSIVESLIVEFVVNES